MMKASIAAAVLLFGSGLPAVASAQAAPAAPAGLPPGVYVGERDPSLAPAGTYALDPAHAAVIARVPHLRYSLSAFRFDKVAGTLTWDPAAPEKSKLSVTVKTASIATNVEGFAAEIADKYLTSAAFPDATFVSTAFRRTGPTLGKVDGQLTLMGKTRPVTFDVALGGAGKGFGHPRIGVEATTVINPVDYGLPPMLSDPIQLLVDVEFEQTP